MAIKRLLSWNVNGLRAVSRSGFAEWFKKESPEALCLQEIKATPEQLDIEVRFPTGYFSYFLPAKKPGYSGVAIYSKREPISVREGLGDALSLDEGRVLDLEFSDYHLINAYFPNSQREHERLPEKLAFCAQILKRCQEIEKEGKSFVLCGDYNIAHTEIDLKNPKTNTDNPGFLPQERAWMDQFLSQGYIDTFRYFNKDPGHYTWWSYRPGVRERNIGWRIDYFVTSKSLEPRLVSASHLTQVLGSDHCPVELALKN